MAAKLQMAGRFNPPTREVTGAYLKFTSIAACRSVNLGVGEPSGARFAEWGRVGLEERLSWRDP